MGYTTRMDRTDLPGILKNTLISALGCGDELATVNEYGDPESRTDILKTLPEILKTRFDLECTFVCKPDMDPFIQHAIDHDALVVEITEILLRNISEVRIASTNTLLE